MVRKWGAGTNLPLILLAIGSIALSGCGGSGGGNVSPSSVIPLSGYVSRSVRMDPANVVSGATVNAYIWPDLTTSVASTTSKADGSYTIDLPYADKGKDIILIGTFTAKVTTASARLSAIVADLPGSGKTVADLDASTTLAAELIVSKAKASGNTPALADLTGPAVETIVSEIRSLSGSRAADLTPDGANIGATFGSGIKADSGYANAIANDKTLQTALTNLLEASTQDVQQGKRMIQLFRDMGHSVLDVGTVSGDSLVTALQDQEKAINDGMSVIGHDFVVRIVRTLDIFWGGGSNDSQLIGGSDYQWDKFKNYAPGQYEWREADGTRTFVKTGDVTDGKSWVITSKVSDATIGWVITITPQNAISQFQVTRRAGNYTVAIRKPDQPTWKWDAVLAFTVDASNRITAVNVTMTANDPGLTAPFSFTGTATGIPDGVAYNENYRQVTLSGTLSSQFVSGSLQNATVNWVNTTKQPFNLLSASITNFQFKTGFSKSLTFSLDNAAINFFPADPAQIKYVVASPQNATLGNATLSGASNSVTLSNGSLVFTRSVDSAGKVSLQTKTIKGSLNYVGSKMSYNGSIDCEWNNLAVSSNVTQSSVMPVGYWPLGTIAFNGTIVPKVGTTASADGVLSFTVNDAKDHAYATLTLNKVAYGTDYVSGAVTAAFPITSSGIKLGSANVQVNLVQSSTGYNLLVSGAPNAMTGYIATNTQGTNKVALIGKASDLGLPDLGSAMIAKYTDNTFETMVSILPY